MNTYRLTFNDEEGRRQQGAAYDPENPLTEEVRANYYDEAPGGIAMFYRRDHEGDGDTSVVVHSAGSIARITLIDGEEEEPAQSVPADPGVAAPPPADENPVQQARTKRWGRKG